MQDQSNRCFQQELAARASTSVAERAARLRNAEMKISHQALTEGRCSRAPRGGILCACVLIGEEGGGFET